MKSVIFTPRAYKGIQRPSIEAYYSTRRIRLGNCWFWKKILQYIMQLYTWFTLVFRPLSFVRHLSLLFFLITMKYYHRQNNLKSNYFLWTYLFYGTLKNVFLNNRYCVHFYEIKFRLAAERCLRGYSRTNWIIIIIMCFCSRKHRVVVVGKILS